MFMEILGYLLAAVMGLTLGLIGGGGSILTVPILVYVLKISPVLATSYSLVVVGSAAAFGAIRYHKMDLVSYKIGLIFGLPSLAAVYITRLYLIPALPEVFFEWNGISFTKDVFIMVFFSALMILTAIFMIRSNGAPTVSAKNGMGFTRAILTVFEGLFVGTVTGIVGAGGGFLIVPALVLLAGIPMKLAVGTSLFIIALKSLVGFAGDLQAGVELDITLLLFFLGATLIGMFAGTHYSKNVPEKRLKHLFGWFVLVLGIIMTIEQVYDL
jgi:uncharacterized protein